MSTLHEAAAACCACIRVRWVETRHETGEVSGRWVCSSCEREFVPAAALDQVRDELNKQLGRASVLADSNCILTSERERLRQFAISIVREKLLHGSNPTLLTLAAKLQLPEVAEILEGRAVEELTSPLTEARAEVRQLRADFARDQAELASLRNQLAARTDERDACHLRTQTAELANEELQRRIENLETRAVSEATLAKMREVLIRRTRDWMTDTTDAREALALLEAEVKP